MKNKVTHSYRTWIRKDFWTHQEAAYLFNEIDPETGTIFENHTPDTTGKSPHELAAIALDIFSRADWSQISELAIDGDQRPYADYFKIADLKYIKVSQRLLDTKKAHDIALQRKIPPVEKLSPTNTNSSQKTITANKRIMSISSQQGVSPEIQKTLQPVIDIIENFAESTEFNTFGVEVQRQFIDAWLESHVETKGEIRTYKKLICKHYGIKNSRKKK